MIKYNFKSQRRQQFKSRSSNKFELNKMFDGPSNHKGWVFAVKKKKIGTMVWLSPVSIVLTNYFVIDSTKYW
jgi:hypothetical protein